MDPIISAITGAGGTLALAGWWIKTLQEEKKVLQGELRSAHAAEVSQAEKLAELGALSISVIKDNNEKMEKLKQEIDELNQCAKSSRVNT